MRTSKSNLLFFSAAICLTLTACGTVPGQVDSGIAVADAKGDQQIAALKQNSQPVQPSQDTYLGPTQALSVNTDVEPTLPDAFNTSFNLNTPNPVTIGQVASLLTEQVGIKLYVEPEAINEIGAIDSGSSAPVDGSRSSQAAGFDATGSSAGGGAAVAKTGYKFSIMYSGTIKGLLDAITARANVFWRWDPDQQRVDIYRTRVRHFEVHALVGAYDFAMNVSNSSGTQAGASSSGGGSSSGVSGTSSSNENTDMKAATVDVWKSIQNDVKSILSPDGILSAGDAVGYLTVRDTPSRLADVQRYVEDLNDRLSRMVAVRVDVIDVSLDHDSNYGIDWNAVYTKAGSYGVSLVTNTVAGSLSNTLTGTVLSANSRWSTSKAMVAALSTQGDAALVTTETLSTQSGMPAPVKVAKETTYLASVSNTSTANVGTSATLTPGVVTAGTSLMVLPFVQDNGQVMVQLSMDVSTLDGITTASSGGSTIQTPFLSVKNFLERVNVHSGETIVVSGFQQVQDNNTYNGVLPPGGASWLGGTSGKEHRKVTTVVLITPYIVKN